MPQLNRRTIVFRLASFVVLGSFCASAQSSACEALLPTTGTAQSARSLTIDDLAKLRDIGPIRSPDTTRDIFSISPDGRWAAFQLHQADVQNDNYCLGMVVAPTDRDEPSRLIDKGGDLIIHRVKSYGWAGMANGVPSPITPRWSVDGRWVAYLKRSEGIMQVWRASIEGAGSRQLSNSPVDVEDFRLTPNGAALIYRARPGLANLEREIDEEGRNRGWRLDDRAYPIRGARPQTPGRAQVGHFSVDLESGEERPATESEIALFSASIPAATGLPATKANNGNLAWGELVHRSTTYGTVRLVVQGNYGRKFVCESDVCKADTRSDIFWDADGSRLRFTRQEGWGDSQTAIYEWKPGSALAERVYETTDRLVECHSGGDDLLCLREGSVQPRRLVRLNLKTKTERLLFDPNPEFSGLNIGRVERLHWRTESGIPSFGDLVFPVDYMLGKRYPLVITQYRTRGFLRGGTGDEVPIQALANRGYLVLSIENLEYEAVVGRRATPEEELAAFTTGFEGRKNQLSQIEVAVRSLIARGLADENRIGISGLSDGSTTVQFAAVNSSLFKAASVGGCCWEPSQDALLGPLVARRYHAAGWPSLVNHDNAYWNAISLVKNAERIKLPMLFQVADTEYLGALESFTALSQAGNPVDMFIFPNEYHIKWRPAHKLAVYRRNLAWFDFWLKDLLPLDPIERQEGLRWQDMRDKIDLDIRADP